MLKLQQKTRWPSPPSKYYKVAMNQYKGIIINEGAENYATDGLGSFIGKEITILRNSYSSADYKDVLISIIDYVLQNKVVISQEQTIAYFSWILQFIESDRGVYELWEAKPDGTGYHRGTDHAINVKLAQEKECEKLGVKPVFPTFSQNIVISEGVYEGMPIDAIRYPSPTHMTGWWLTTDLYDNNIDSLMNVHFFHVAFKRPDILKLLALPFGHRFHVDQKGSEVWLDKKILD